MTTNPRNATYVRVMNKVSARGTTAVSGTVAVSNFPATQPVSVATLPSVTLATNPPPRTDVIDAAGTLLTPKFAVISSALLGDNALVAAVASKKIRVTSLFMVATLANGVTFFSGAGGTAKSGVMPIAANAIIILPDNPRGWFETASNTALVLNIAIASLVAGGLSYVEV